MFPAVGLQTYIWNNRLKSLVLLAGFPVLLLFICFGFALLIAALQDPTVGQGIEDAFRLLPQLVPVAIGGSLVWFAIAWFANQWIIDAITGARKVERVENPRVYNILENLAISRGLTMPTLRVIDTDALNAFASGVRDGHYSVTVTSGLLSTLDDRELGAVLGHELTHIRNRDVQLLVISAVFVGIISLVGDLIIRAPRMLFWGNWSGGSGGSRQRSDNKSDGKGGGGAIVLILIAVAIFIISRLLATALRLALSRNREYLADAGSVELTKDPDAMISALRKIEGHAEIAAPAQIQEMFLENPHAGGITRLFFTHPTIDARVEALVRYAGGHDLGAALGAARTAARAPASRDDGDDGASGPWVDSSSSNSTEVPPAGAVTSGHSSIPDIAPGLPPASRGSGGAPTTDSLPESAPVFTATSDRSPVTYSAPEPSPSVAETSSYSSSSDSPSESSSSSGSSSND